MPAGYVLNGAALGAGVPSINITNVTVNDGAAGNTAVFAVSLSQPSTSTVTVNYATADGTAHSGTDYKAASGVLTFSPGIVSQSITVAINPDTTAKPNETFSVVLSGAKNAAIATASGLGTIVDVIGAPHIRPKPVTFRPRRWKARRSRSTSLRAPSDPGGLCAVAGFVFTARAWQRRQELERVAGLYSGCWLPRL